MNFYWKTTWTPTDTNLLKYAVMYGQKPEDILKFELYQAYHLFWERCKDLSLLYYKAFWDFVMGISHVNS